MSKLVRDQLLEQPDPSVCMAMLYVLDRDGALPEDQLYAKADEILEAPICLADIQHRLDLALMGGE